MATVTGITAERAEAIHNASIVTGRIDEAGQLLLTTRGGTVINAGAVIAPKAAVEKAHPVGSIYLTTSPTNPGNSAVLGIGSWVRWGQGRVPVSQADGDTTFDTVEETGGVKEVTLTGPQSGIPAHTHAFSGTTENWNKPTLAAQDSPALTGTVARPMVVGSPGGATLISATYLDHKHAFSGTTTASEAVVASQAHTNLQPYIVCYMWKRTA